MCVIIVCSGLFMAVPVAAQEGTKFPPPGPAQSQVVPKWQTQVIKEVPFEAGLQVGIAPEYMLVSFLGATAANGTPYAGYGSSSVATIPLMQNETVTRDLAGIKVRIRGLENEVDLEPCTMRLTLSGAVLAVRIEPGLRCRLANPDWGNIRLEFRVFALR